MNNDLLDFIKKINQQISEEHYSYVYFDNSSGKIEKILNKKEESDISVLKILSKEIEHIILGKQRIEDFRVIFDNKKRCLELVHLDLKSDKEDINQKIFQVDRVNRSQIQSYDLTIRQNNKDQCWNFFINDNLKLLELNNNNMFFSITAKNDPNILYRTIVFNTSDLFSECVSVPYKFESESDIENISVYTNRIFEKYAHEVLDD
jgi:hypothetical protein